MAHKWFGGSRFYILLPKLPFSFLHFKILAYAVLFYKNDAANS